MQKNDQEQPEVIAQNDKPQPNLASNSGFYQSETTAKIDKQLAKAQAEMVGAIKGSTNPFFISKYADLSEVIRAVS